MKNNLEAYESISNNMFADYGLLYLSNILIHSIGSFFISL